MQQEREKKALCRREADGVVKETVNKDVGWTVL
jgi:hypothetical protein